MTSTAVRRGMLLVALPLLAACPRGGAVKPLTGPKTFTFKTTFAAPGGCPDASTPDAANCKNKKKDCAYASKKNKDVVRFWPTNDGDPQYTIEFAPDSGLTTIPDPSAPNDGKHWQLQISDRTQIDVEYKFSVVVKPGCRLDPSVIIGP